MKEENAISCTRTAFGGANIENGVYLVYKDGTYVRFDRNQERYDVAFIGLAYDGHTFGIHLCGSKGRYPLINTARGNAPEDDLCFENEWDALMEWDFVKHTRHIQEIGTDIPLNDGEYLPTLACLMVMFHYSELINHALEHAGGKTIDFGSLVWSCLRYSGVSAWLAYGFIGFFSINFMYYALQAVPLSLWEPGKARS